MIPPRAGGNLRAVSFRSLFALILLLLIAAGGIAAVHELTQPAPREPVGPINIDPNSGMQPGESAEDDGSPRSRARRDERRQRDGDAPRSGGATDGGAGNAPEPPPPQPIVVPGDDEGGED
jgi:hypothetical protein